MMMKLKKKKKNVVCNLENYNIRVNFIGFILFCYIFYLN